MWNGEWKKKEDGSAGMPFFVVRPDLDVSRLNGG